MTLHNVSLFLLDAIEGGGSASMIERLDASWTSSTLVHSELFGVGEGEVMFRRGSTYYVLMGNGCCFCPGKPWVSSCDE
jgi:hypothetical protein